MHEKTLTENTKRVLKTLSSTDFINNFYLAGGTALALFLGHRRSVDLDWFAQDFTYNPEFRKRLAGLGQLQVSNEGEKTFNGSLNGVKISFFEYPYPLISSKEYYEDNVYLAGKPDIAAMKLDAVASRGTYKDFVDIYFLLEEYSLGQLLKFFKDKFSDVDYNEAHLLKSLTYFEDTEDSKYPELIEQVDWKKIR